MSTETRCPRRRCGTPSTFSRSADGRVGGRAGSPSPTRDARAPATPGDPTTPGDGSTPAAPDDGRGTASGTTTAAPGDGTASTPDAPSRPDAGSTTPDAPSGGSADGGSTTPTPGSPEEQAQQIVEALADALGTDPAKVTDALTQGKDVATKTFASTLADELDRTQKQVEKALTAVKFGDDAPSTGDPKPAPAPGGEGSSSTAPGGDVPAPGDGGPAAPGCGDTTPAPGAGDGGDVPAPGQVEAPATAGTRRPRVRARRPAPARPRRPRRSEHRPVPLPVAVGATRRSASPDPATGEDGAARWCTTGRVRGRTTTAPMSPGRRRGPGGSAASAALDRPVRPPVLIVSGELQLAPGRRDAFVAAAVPVMEAARRAPGCLEFVLAADPATADRVVILERWASTEELLAFRGDGPSDGSMSDVVSGDVHRYEIATIGPA
ncbi:antibiotic biosynthesis monooxygenase [Patulibacter minatonensis]|uniref:antibiotic biosynthesis monooxygenase n=1 Tax=Patulibacter minatonensis TaxID=298163 RepID=UPI000685202D|nr:antibiotic biosynthesis monooxygenase [Patulibacter minatonensis]